MHRKLIDFAQASFIDTTVMKRSSAYLIEMTEVSVENKRREKCLDKERARKDFPVTGFTQFKALLLFCKQHYKHISIVIQYYTISVTNLSA